MFRSRPRRLKVNLDPKLILLFVEKLNLKISGKIINLEEIPLVCENQHDEKSTHPELIRLFVRGSNKKKKKKRRRNVNSSEPIASIKMNVKGGTMRLREECTRDSRKTETSSVSSTSHHVWNKRLMFVRWRVFRGNYRFLAMASYGIHLDESTTV